MRRNPDKHFHPSLAREINHTFLRKYYFKTTVEAWFNEAGCSYHRFLHPFAYEWKNSIREGQTNALISINDKNMWKLVINFRNFLSPLKLRDKETELILTH